MSAPPVPGWLSGTQVVLRLAWTRMVRGSKLRLGVVATLLVVGAAVATRYAAAASEPAQVMEAALRLGFFGMLAYLLPFLFTSGAVAEEVEGRTMPFLALRPSGRVALALGKYAAGAGMSVLLLWSGVLVLHVAVHATSPSAMVEHASESLRAAGALGLLALAYSAICLFWGAAVVEAGWLLSTLHLAALEFGLGWLPGMLRLGSMNYLATQIAGLPRGGFWPEGVPDVDVWVCVVVVSLVGAVFAVLATLVLRTSELGLGRA